MTPPWVAIPAHLRAFPSFSRGSQFTAVEPCNL
eukprot:CAMPEP_0194762086 /NCGR_PEP_ID=MMETSP0323_2-20130528/14671_1 /TAXON_ID=2866 ORGANISM="Crypthecodinium cohnii, Strain Seligo" /NCGR_SAMPLE_ID=MMETSP0323_2 /ASSEMBLY_ACC=CAM_ASM_000346 /LENGTH=32 /DNA_ID= /DNA_START= /DNA_END= /DNA_ORIENTATION=